MLKLAREMLLESAFTMTFGSLFSGIGGMDLGLERAGMECRWQVEIDPFCTRVLEKHWPGVKRYGDIRAVDGSALAAVDCIAGGFPCQDVSGSGPRIGIDGPRSGLWGQFARLIGEIRPKFALVENVSGLFVRGIGRVLGDLADLGYDAEWSVVPACALGAPHSRERVFILAYPGQHFDGRLVPVSSAAQALGWKEGQWCADRQFAQMGTEADSGIPRLAEWWRTEPAMGRMAARVPGRVDRLRVLGNAVVPQVAEWIGRRIVAALEKSAQSTD